MKTIEERAKSILLQSTNQPTAIDLYSRDEVLKMLVKMATEQKAIDIDKACEYFADWMRRHNDYAQFAVDGLRKALEE